MSLVTINDNLKINKDSVDAVTIRVNSDDTKSYTVYIGTKTFNLSEDEYKKLGI